MNDTPTERLRRITRRGGSVKTKLLGLAMALTLATSAHAEFETGNTLLAQMNGNLTMRAMAIGYVAGVHDSARGSWHCSPASVTLGQVWDMTRQYLEEHPQFRHFTGDTIVTLVLRKAWPCAATKK